jgi:hypothetical protein
MREEQQPQLELSGLTVRLFVQDARDVNGASPFGMFSWHSWGSSILLFWERSELRVHKGRTYNRGGGG